MKKINPPEGKKKDVPVRKPNRAQAPKPWIDWVESDISAIASRFPIVETPKGSAKAAGRSRPKSSRNPGVTPKSPTPKPSRRAG